MEPLRRFLISRRRSNRSWFLAFGACGVAFQGLYFVLRGPFSGLMRHYALRGASRLRCWYRFTSAKAAQSHWWFFQIPR